MNPEDTLAMSQMAYAKQLCGRKHAGQKTYEIALASAPRLEQEALNLVADGAELDLSEFCNVRRRVP
jgi:hypothetical protein